jgi:hypothetical protein
MGLDRSRRHAVAAGVGQVVPRRRHACFGAAVRPTRRCTVLFYSRFASSVPPLRPHSSAQHVATHVERLRAAGCGLKCKLISLGPWHAPYHHINRYIRLNHCNSHHGMYDCSPPNSLL